MLVWGSVSGTNGIKTYDNELDFGVYDTHPHRMGHLVLDEGSRLDMSDVVGLSKTSPVDPVHNRMVICIKNTLYVYICICMYICRW